MYYRLSLVTIILSFTAMLVSSSPVPAVVPEAQVTLMLQMNLRGATEAAIPDPAFNHIDCMKLQLKLHMCIVYHSDL
ncbi:hypothetical protein EDD85DRAFT_948229 [Armillaria nabsnona]|nr:hypothetical protein EDD85DRAFT_948229 [Armillaria nabsnona]